MKKNYLKVCIFIILGILICNTPITVKGAAAGLTLWYQALIPALLPYMIISNVIIQYGMTETAAILFKPLTRILKLEQASGYCILSGLFFGCPSCASTASSMHKSGLINSKTADICICSFNSVSPAYLTGYVCMSILKNNEFMYIVPSIHFLTVIINSFFVRYILFGKSGFLSETDVSYTVTKKAAGHGNPVSQAMTAVIKLGGYIVMFSIISAHAAAYTGKAAPWLCSIIEVTTGSASAGTVLAESAFLLPVIMSLQSFGGICGMCQTMGTAGPEILSRKKYITGRLSASVISFLLSFLYITLK